MCPKLVKVKKKKDLPKKAIPDAVQILLAGINPLLVEQKNQVIRIQFAEEHLNKERGFLNKVLFIYECPSIFLSLRSYFVRRK